MRRKTYFFRILKVWKSERRRDIARPTKLLNIESFRQKNRRSCLLRHLAAVGKYIILCLPIRLRDTRKPDYFHTQHLQCIRKTINSIVPFQIQVSPSDTQHQATLYYLMVLLFSNLSSSLKLQKKPVSSLHQILQG